MFQRLLATALIAGSAIAAPAQAAQPHLELARAVIASGVSLQINPADCASRDGVLGWYAGQQRRMVVCLEKGVDQKEWTAEDFDTLRHEAQHLIQDCMVGTDHDHVLGPVYQQPVDLALDVLGRDNSQRIVRQYREGGASDHVLVLELEAFAVARMNVPAEQAADIRRYCL